MVAPTGTFQTFQATVNREDLLDIITNISPTDCPFMANIGESDAENQKHEWPEDTLAAPDATNAQIEGNDIAGQTSAAVTRSYNYCQISTKDVVVSRSQRKANHAGTDDFFDYEIIKKGKELKRDCEAIMTRNQGSSVGDATSAKKLRSLESWLTSNVSMNNVTTTVNGATTGSTTAGANSTSHSVARTDASGIERAIDEEYVKDVIQSVLTAGGEPEILMAGPFNKRQISGFTGRSQARQSVSSDTILAAASIYASDFGDFRVIPNRFQRERSAFVLDSETLATSYYDRMHEHDLAKTGDADKKFLVVEYTLEITAEAANGIIADIKTTT